MPPPRRCRSSAVAQEAAGCRHGEHDAGEQKRFLRLGGYVRTEAEDDRAPSAGGADDRANVGSRREPARAGVPGHAWCRDPAAPPSVSRHCCQARRKLQDREGSRGAPGRRRDQRDPRRERTEVHTRIKLEEKLETYRTKS